jgi:hypothetical protein
MAAGEDNIKTASKSGDAGKVAIAYAAYLDSMNASGVTPKPLQDILGHK